MMRKAWILVADSSRARVFTAETQSSSLEELETLAHPEGRLHEQNMDSDLPGKDTGNGGAGGHAYQDQTEPKEQEAINFAKRIAKHLDEARNAKKYEQLVVVAAPAFLGELRNQFSGQVGKLVCYELSKNLTTHDTADIRKHLPEYLPCT
jgi:protein required for attachment to host cells